MNKSHRAKPPAHPWEGAVFSFFCRMASREAASKDPELVPGAGARPPAASAGWRSLHQDRLKSALYCKLTEKTAAGLTHLRNCSSFFCWKPEALPAGAPEGGRAPTSAQEPTCAAQGCQRQQGHTGWALALPLWLEAPTRLTLLPQVRLLGPMLSHLGHRWGLVGALQEWGFLSIKT